MNRSTWILVAVLAVLLVAAFFVLRQPGEVSTSGNAADVLARYDSAAVDKLEIASPSGVVALAIEGGKWMIVSPLRYPADQLSVTAAIGKGKRIELKNVVSSNPQKQQLFQVDSAGTLVRVFEHGTQGAAFHVGKPGASYAETYVRREGSNDVYLADGLLTYTFAKSVKEWRDKTIFKSDPDRIRNVRLQFRDTTLALQFQDSLWRVDGDSASQTAVRSFLDALTNLQTDEFVDTAVTVSSAPNAVIEVEGVQIRFYPGNDGGKYFVQTSAGPQWFEIQQWRAAQALKRKKDFLAGAP
jgi:hypothetical protein